MPDPITTPTRSAFSSVTSNPESSSAICDAASA